MIFAPKVPEFYIMKIFIHQRKLVAENLTKHLTNNKKDGKNSQFMTIPKYQCPKNIFPDFFFWGGEVWGGGHVSPAPLSYAYAPSRSFFILHFLIDY